MGNNKENFVQRVLGTKKRAERGLQSVGANIRTNIQAGNAAFNNRANNSNYYATTNPFKGARDAFMRGYNSQ